MHSKEETTASTNSYTKIANSEERPYKLHIRLRGFKVDTTLSGVAPVENCQWTKTLNIQFKTVANYLRNSWNGALKLRERAARREKPLRQSDPIEQQRSHCSIPNNSQHEENITINHGTPMKQKRKT
jgi:hypothetical protein